MMINSLEDILPETNSKFAPEKMDGWKTICFLLGRKAYFQGYDVSFREGIFLGGIITSYV